MGRAKISLLTRWWYSKVSEQTTAEIDKFQLKSHRTVHTLFELEWTFNFPNDIARAGQKNISHSAKVGRIEWRYRLKLFLYIFSSFLAFRRLVCVACGSECVSTAHRRVNRMRFSAAHISPHLVKFIFLISHASSTAEHTEWETHHLQSKLYPTFFASDEKTQKTWKFFSLFFFSSKMLVQRWTGGKWAGGRRKACELNLQWKHEKLSKSTRHTTRLRNVVIC